MIDVEDRDENRRLAKHILNSRKYGSLGVSLLAVGEVLGKMAQDRGMDTCLTAMRHLRRMLDDGTLFLRGFGRGNEAMCISLEMMAVDPMVTPSDALIIACALLDDECTGLLTIDEEIIYSREVSKLMTQHGVRAIDPRVLVKGRSCSRHTANLRLSAETITMPLQQSLEHVRVHALP